MTVCHLRNWRLRNNLTLDDVSALTGYSSSLLSRVERGQRNLPPMSRVALARALGAPLRDLFEVPERDSTTQPAVA